MDRHQQRAVEEIVLDEHGDRDDSRHRGSQDASMDEHHPHDAGEQPIFHDRLDERVHHQLFGAIRRFLAVAGADARNDRGGTRRQRLDHEAIRLDETAIAARIGLAQLGAALAEIVPDSRLRRAGDDQHRRPDQHQHGPARQIEWK
ncbi:MAG: hypothetical protein ACTHM0_02750 [Sphingomonas sp.]